MDERKFKEIFATYQRRLYLYVWHYCRNHDTTADVCQETWLSAHHKLPEQMTPGAIWTWLSRVAKNKLIDHMRQQQRRREIKLGEIEVQERIRDPAYAVAFREQLARCFEKLPERYRDFVVRLLDLQAYDQMEQETNLPRSRLMQLKSIIKKQLEICLERKL